MWEEGRVSECKASEPDLASEFVLEWVPDLVKILVSWLKALDLEALLVLEGFVQSAQILVQHQEILWDSQSLRNSRNCVTARHDGSDAAGLVGVDSLD